MQDDTKKTPERPTFAQVLRTIWRGLSTNLWLKVLSLLFAILIWGFLISSDASLTREKSFTDVEVTVTGADTLRQRSFIVLEDVAALVPTVNFTAEVQQTNYDKATGASFGPRIDLTRIRSLGVQELPITMTSNSFGTVTQIDPPSVEVTVERYRTRTRIPILIEVVGELPEGLWADTPKADPQLVTVGGPEPLLQKVVRGKAQLDASMLTGNTPVERNAIPFVLVDEDDQPLDSSLLTVTYEGVILDSVTAEVNTYPTKVLPVDESSVTTGTLPEGYAIEELVIEPAEVEVAASKSALDELSQVFVETPLDLSELTETTTAPLRLKRLTDAKHLSVEEVTVTVVIGQSTRTRTLRNVPVEIRNLDETRYTARLAAGSLDVTLTGPYHDIAAVTQEDIVLWVDAADWTEEEPNLPVQVQIDNHEDLAIRLSADTLRMRRTSLGTE